MPAAVTNHPTVGVQYTVVDAHGNKATIQQTSPVGTVRFLQITVGGTLLTVSQQNVKDLIVALTGFGNTGNLT